MPQSGPAAKPPLEIRRRLLIRPTKRRERVDNPNVGGPDKLTLPAEQPLLKSKPPGKPSLHEANKGVPSSASESGGNGFQLSDRSLWPWVSKGSPFGVLWFLSHEGKERPAGEAKRAYKSYKTRDRSENPNQPQPQKSNALQIARKRKPSQRFQNTPPGCL